MAQPNQNQNQNQNEAHPFWDFVRSMDNLGINANAPPGGPHPHPPHPNTGGPGPNRPQGGRGGPPGPFDWAQGAFGPGGFNAAFGAPIHGYGGPLHGGGYSPFGPPRHGPGGHRGRHHRRRRSHTPSSSSSRSRSPSPHAERPAGGPGEDFHFGPPPHPPHPAHPPHPPHPHPPHPHSPHPHPHHHGGRRGRRGWARGPPPPPFDVNAFLANITSHPIAQNLMQGFIPQTGTRNANGTDTTGTESTSDETSFTPPLDLFTTPTAYTLHISLPGAKKEDVGVHYSATTSTLAISGVVYRPGNDEFLTTMTSSERRVGMFERNVVLKGEDGGDVDGDGITAKMEDGVLIVTVPRVEKEWEDIKSVEID